MSKTKKFLMEVNVLDTIQVSTRISETEYKKKLKSLKEQVEKTQEDPDMEDTFVARDEEKQIFHTEYEKYLYRATLGTTDIELVALICRPGYCFKD